MKRVSTRIKNAQQLKIIKQTSFTMVLAGNKLAQLNRKDTWLQAMSYFGILLFFTIK